jgi:hypothetical protein
VRSRPGHPISTIRVRWARANVLFTRAADPADRTLAARRIARSYWLFALALIPWIVYLAVVLPRRNFAEHYRLSWIGFDLALALVLARTAYLANRHDPRVVLPANAAGALLIADAWFDITTSDSRAAALTALASALLLELPIATLSLLIARRALRNIGRTPVPGDPDNP